MTNVKKTEHYVPLKNYVLAVVIVVVIILLASIKQIDEYERGVKFAFGKYSKVLNPGWHIILPIFQSFK